MLKREGARWFVMILFIHMYHLIIHVSFVHLFNVYLSISNFNHLIEPWWLYTGVRCMGPCSYTKYMYSERSIRVFFPLVFETFRLFEIFQLKVTHSRRYVESRKLLPHLFRSRASVRREEERESRDFVLIARIHAVLRTTNR